MSKKDEAKELYEAIAKAYMPIYFPSEEEKSEAINNLVMAMYAKKLNKEMMIKKAKIMATLHGNHKSKVTSLILNKYWEQEVEYGVIPQKFKEDE